MANQIMIPRHIGNGKGLVMKNSIDSETTVIDARGNTKEPIDFFGVQYLECQVGDRIIIQYTDKKQSRTFKVVEIERSGQFFVCEIIYTVEESVEIELLNIAEMINGGQMTTNEGHLKADQLLVSLLYDKGLDTIADAFNKVPKYYE